MKKILYITFFVLYALLIIMFLVTRGGNIPPFIGTPFFLAFLFALLASGGMAIKGFGLKNVHGKAMLFLLVGMTLKIVGETVPFMLGTTTETLQSFSIFRILTVLGYILLLSGLIIELRQSKITWNTKKILIYISLIAAISFLVIYFGVIMPDILSAESNYYINTFFDLLLGIIAVTILLLVREYKGGTMVLPWLLIMGCFLAAILNNILIVNFSEQLLAEIWPYENLYMFVMLSFVLLAHGLYKMRVVVDEANASLKQKLTNPS